MLLSSMDILKIVEKLLMQNFDSDQIEMRRTDGDKKNKEKEGIAKKNISVRSIKFQKNANICCHPWLQNEKTAD